MSICYLATKLCGKFYNKILSICILHLTTRIYPIDFLLETFEPLSVTRDETNRISRLIKKNQTAIKKLKYFLSNDFFIALKQAAEFINSSLTFSVLIYPAFT